MLQLVVDDASTWPVDEVVVVLGSDGETVVESISFGDATVLIDPEWGEGGASPLRAVLDMISRTRDSSVVVLARGDQPGIDARLVGELIARASETHADAVLPKFRYATGWPVVLSPAFWTHLLGLEGSVDVHGVIKTHAASVEEVWVDRIAPPILVTVDDLTR